MARAIYRNCNESIDFPADRDYEVGELVQKLGKVGITIGEFRRDQGQQIEICFDARVELEKADPALVIAEGDVVGYVAATQTAVAAGAGDFDVGVASIGGSTAGRPSVMVMLNFQ